jgi:hypothetical protein
LGSGTRRRPIERDYAAAKDAEWGSWNSECGMRKAELGSGKKECGLRPVGAIRAYAPEGSGKMEFGRGTRRRPIERDYAAAKDAERGSGNRKTDNLRY